MSLKIAQTAAFIPLFGYMIIFQEDLQPFFVWSVDGAGGLYLGSEVRINLVYFGSLLLLLSSIVYYLACDGCIKDHTDANTYALFVKDGAANIDLLRNFDAVSRLLVRGENKFFSKIDASEVDAEKAIYSLKSQAHSMEEAEFSEKVGLVLRDYYAPKVVVRALVSNNYYGEVPKIYFLYQENNRPFWLFLTLLFFLVGLFLFLIPSLEVVLLATLSAIS